MSMCGNVPACRRVEFWGQEFPWSRRQVAVSHSTTWVWELNSDPKEQHRPVPAEPPFQTHHPATPKWSSFSPGAVVVKRTRASTAWRCSPGVQEEVSSFTFPHKCPHNTKGVITMKSFLPKLPENVIRSLRGQQPHFEKCWKTVAGAYAANFLLTFWLTTTNPLLVSAQTFCFRSIIFCTLSSINFLSAFTNFSFSSTVL